MEAHFILPWECVGKTFVSVTTGKESIVIDYFTRWEHNVMPDEGHEYIEYFRIAEGGKTFVKECYAYLQGHRIIES